MAYNPNFPSPGNSIEPTDRDLQTELTELEYRASQGPLNSEEQTRLEQLRRKRGSIAASAQNYIGRAEDAGNTVSGDDSP